MTTTVPEALAPAAILLVVSVFIASYDVRQRRIPDLLVYPAVVIIAAVRVIVGNQPVMVALDLAIGGMVFLVVRMVTGGRLGWGDVKYSALICVGLGIWGWFVALAVACTAAGVWFLRLARQGRSDESIAFAPFLAIGTVAGAVVSLIVPAELVLGLA
jgi:prepilin signal peptidase PulO-like enzyme (type II secretory pathway)